MKAEEVDPTAARLDSASRRERTLARAKLARAGEWIWLSTRLTGQEL